ncbi:MAG TPA: GNAT family N-acetyltransferase, partial [Acidimicrobiales bacterium]|nr:GNAT family N-acetyltransferase [Acidimicrobiales bacterium]
MTVYAGHDLRARLRGRSAVVIDGPVLGEGDPGPALARLLPDLETASRRMRARSLTLVPPTGAGWADQPEARALLDSRGYRCDEWMTAVVDLARTPDELFGAFRRSARKAVRRAEELGVRIVRCADIEEYASRFRPAYREGRRAMGLGLPPEKDVAAMADLIGTTYHFFLAVDGSDGRTLATLGTYRFCGMATEVASVQTNEGRVRGYPAQDLLHWEAMRFHCSLGDQAFDLAGYNPAPTSEKEAGIARFKQKWGGTPVSTPRFHLRLPRR